MGERKVSYYKRNGKDSKCKSASCKTFNLNIDPFTCFAQVKCPYDQGILKNLQCVLGRWPIFWLIPKSMSGTGLDFAITTKYIDDCEEATLEEKDFSSSIQLNRTDSVHSQWTTVSDLSRSNTVESHKRASHQLRVDITPLTFLKTKPSSNTISSTRSIMPTTPGSIMTFASTATTLVDYHSKSPFKPSTSYPMGHDLSTHR